MVSTIKQGICFIRDNGVQDGMNLELLRKIRLINVFCFLGIVVILPISIQTFLLGRYFMFFVDILVASVFVASFLYLRRTSKFVFSAHVFIHALFLLLIYLVYSGGVEKTGPVWIFVFPVVVLSLYESRRGMIYIVLFTILILGIFSFPSQFLGAAEYPVDFKFRLFCSYLIVTILAAVYEFYRQETFLRMKALSDQLEIMSKHDSLTGLMNRRGIYERLEYEQVRNSRSNTVYSIIIGDIDKFKTINDTYGHDAGDHVLKMLPQVFMEHTRAQDLVARWGGEEFLFLLPKTGFKGAHTLGEKVRKAVQEMALVYSGDEMRITMSFGVKEIGPDNTYEDGILMADRSLFEAKKQGRNCVHPDS